MDECLEPYLSAGKPQERELLDELMRDHAAPVILRAVRSRLEGAWDDIEDVCSEAQLELLIHLGRIKAQPTEGIRDFPAYVAGIATNACRQYFRRRRPGWGRLRRQILYFAQQERGVRVSTGGDGMVWFALSQWPPNRTPAAAEMVEQLAGELAGNRDLGTVIRGALEAASGLVELNALVSVVARLWHVAPDPWTADSDVVMESVAAPGEPIELGIHRRNYVARLWQELLELPRPQRVALLLNLRDGRGNPALSLFPLSGVAKFADIAAALEISSAELATMWNDMPYEDRAIGLFLGCTQQQVINLRMAARKRLNNRLRDER